MSSNFQQSVYRDGFLTQWGFHRVQEHPKRSSLLNSILILIFLPFTCSLFTITYFTIHYYVFTIYYYVFIITYLLFISLCTMHYALFTYSYVFIRIHYFIRIHMYLLFQVTKSRDFGTYA